MEIKDQEIIWQGEHGEERAPLYSEKAFSLINHLWLKIGWHFHTHYTFTWMGRPVLQLPEDLVRLQEVIFTLKPDLIIETGVALGGSMLFYATLVRALNHGHVVGIDIDLRPQTKAALVNHELSQHITLLEGSSLLPEILQKVDALCKEAQTVLVILDSNHSKEHVLNELWAYAPFVTEGSYLIVADGFKKHLHDVPRGKPEWAVDHPQAAVEEFIQNNASFVLDRPLRPYSRAKVSTDATHFVDGYLKRI